MRAAFPDIHFTWDDFVVEGDKVVGRWTCQGTHAGYLPTMGIEPTGKRVTFTGITIHHIANDKVVTEWESWDRLSLLQQLNAIPLAETSAV